MCSVFNISKSGYYSRFNRLSSKWEKENNELILEIINIHEKSKQTYGSPRITAELKSQDINVSRPRVARLMKKANIRSKIRRKYVVTTDSKHSFEIAPNILNRDFKAESPGQKWVSDITYIGTKQRWLYLTVVLDLYDRKIIGWSLSSSLKAKETVIPALKMALNNRSKCDSLIFHSDRGVQYACNIFKQLLKKENIKQSMSRKGNCWDNAVAESFFKTIKVEWIYSRTFINQNQATLSIFEWIESWYNKKRRHSYLGYKTIDEFEKLNINFVTAA
jgi:transposase InsO family protein